MGLIREEFSLSDIGTGVATSSQLYLLSYFDSCYLRVLVWVGLDFWGLDVFSVEPWTLSVLGKC